MERLTRPLDRRQQAVWRARGDATVVRPGWSRGCCIHVGEGSDGPLDSLIQAILEGIDEPSSERGSQAAVR